MTSESPRLLAVLQTVAESAMATDIHHILNVGVGLCFECEWLTDLFPDASITLVDHDQEVVKRLQSDHDHRSERIRIVHDDASRFLSNNSVMYDLILLRHPNVDDDRDRWRAVFEAMPVRSRVGGMLIATFYTLHELRFCESVIAAKGDSPIIEVVKVLDPVSLDGRDRYILKYFMQVNEC